MSAGAEALLDRLRGILRGYESVVVAYSGGVDSTLVALLAREALGDRAVACIGRSPSLARSECEAAVALAGRLEFACRVVETTEYLLPDYAANTGDRCFHCKAHLFGRLRELARAEGFAHLADGVHAGDAGTHGGGIRAAREFGVRSPLWEAGLGKAEVRTLARYLGLPNADKPAAPCLASRVPVGTPVTVGLLGRVERAEAAVAAMGFRNFRVRHHGELARLELAEGDWPRVVAERRAILDAVRAAGYRQVTLDLATRAET